MSRAECKPPRLAASQVDMGSQLVVFHNLAALKGFQTRVRGAKWRLMSQLLKGLGDTLFFEGDLCLFPLWTDLLERVPPPSLLFILSLSNRLSIWTPVVSVSNKATCGAFDINQTRPDLSRGPFLNLLDRIFAFFRELFNTSSGILQK